MEENKVNEILNKNDINQIKKKKNIFSNNNDMCEELLCCICLVNKSTHAAIPCGHLRYCEGCSSSLMKSKNCFICRESVVSINKIFK